MKQFSVEVKRDVLPGLDFENDVRDTLSVDAALAADNHERCLCERLVTLFGVMGLVHHNFL